MEPSYIKGRGQIHGLFRTLLLCIGVHLWFSYVQDANLNPSKKAKKPPKQTGPFLLPPPPPPPPLPPFPVRPPKKTPVFDRANNARALALAWN